MSNNLVGTIRRIRKKTQFPRPFVSSIVVIIIDDAGSAKLEHKVVRMCTQSRARDYREGNGPGELSRSSRRGQNTGLEVSLQQSRDRRRCASGTSVWASSLLFINTFTIAR